MFATHPQDNKKNYVLNNSNNNRDNHKVNIGKTT